MRNTKCKAIDITKRIVAVVLALALLLDLLPGLALTSTVQAAAAPQQPTTVVQTTLEGKGYGQNKKFLVPIDEPIKGSIPISSLEDLKKIGKEYYLNANYHLTANIDMSGINWEPIDDFTGTFDGQGYVIGNMTITGDYDNAGLFGIISTGITRITPVLKNIGLENVNINVTATTHTYVGGLLGYNTRGYVDISNCYVTGQVTGNSNAVYAGGIVGLTSGYNPAGCLNLNDCYSTATITANAITFSDTEVFEGLTQVAGSAYAGGIIGCGDDAKMISNCYNVGEIKADSTGLSTAGGVAAFLYDNDTVSNCSNTGNVTAISNDELSDTKYVSTGGIIGMNATNDTMSTTIACYNAGNISATLTTANTVTEIFAGGIGGRTHGQILSDCYNTGTVLASNLDNTRGYAGGIVGRNSEKSSVRRCYSIGNISGTLTGGVVGLATSGSVTRNSFWQEGSALRSIGEDKAAGNGASNTTIMSAVQMKQESSFPFLNFSQVWGFKSGENDGYPILQTFYPGWTYTPTVSAPEPSIDFLAPIEAPKAGSIPIGSIEDLRLIGSVLPLSKDYHLTANINLIGIDWVPIGSGLGASPDSFTGTFDGQGYAIHNLETTGSHNIAGLFGEIAGTASIKNLGLENVYLNVTGTSTSDIVYVGGLVGENWRGNVTISNCYVTGEVTGAARTTYAAGMIGYMDPGGGKLTITDCYNAAAVTASGSEIDVGGIIGRASNAKTIRNCHNAGNITATATNFCAASGIAAWVSKNDTIRDCSNTGEVYASTSGAGTYLSAGGVIGFNAIDDDMSTTTNCYNTGDISAVLTSSYTSTEIFAGGIGGRTHGQAMSDCYNTGNISAMNANNASGYAGGIVGRNSVDSSVRRCYSTGDVSAAPYAGGVIGLAMPGSFAKDCFWNSTANQTSSNSAVAQGDKKGVGSGEDTTTPLTAVQMKEEASFVNVFSLTQTWGFQSGANDGYPVLRAFYPNMNYIPSTPKSEPVRNFLVTDFDPPAAGSTPIATREDLDNIRNNLSGTYHLTADIDLTGVDWEPIWDDSQYNNPTNFTGTFDGQGHVIIGLEVVAFKISTSSAYTGLFGCVGGNASIQNVGLENVCIYNTAWNSYAGGLFGSSAGSVSINNCYVTGMVHSGGAESLTTYGGGIAGYVGGTPEVISCYNTAKVTNRSTQMTCSGYAGGIAGAIKSGHISNCHNTGELIISQTEIFAGGIVGSINNSTDVSNCHNTGNITVDINSSFYGGYAGGIAGRIYDAGSSISAAYNTGDVAVSCNRVDQNAEVGGIAGRSSGKVMDCYNRGNLTADGQESTVCAAGVVGNSLSGSSIATCYSTGNVTSGTTLGGVAGNTNTATITDTFWNNESVQTVNGYAFPAAIRMGIGVGTGAATGLNTAQMKQQASFTNFDFDTVWEMVNGQNDGYPVLREKTDMYTVKVQYKLSATASYGTSISSGSYARGEIVTINGAGPGADYRFKEWTSTAVGVVFADKNSVNTTFVMPAGSITVTAIYEGIPYRTLTVKYGSGGGSKREGAAVYISAGSPANGKKFKEWVADGDDVIFTDKNSSSTTVIMPTRDTIIEATYEDAVYTITVNGGTANPSTATANTTVTITADAPPAGKVFDRWSTLTSGVKFGSTTSAVTTFTMPVRDVTITATYKDLRKENQAAPSAPTLASKTSTSVTLKTISGAEYCRGSGAWQDSPVFSGLSPDTNYYFYARLKETTTHNASSASSSLSVRTDAKSETTTTTRAVTVKGGYAGTSSGAGTYAQGAMVTIKAGKRSGYTFTGWTVNAGGVTLAKRTNATTTFTMKASAVTVTANWKRTAAVKPSIKAQPKAPGGKLKRNAKYTLKISAKASPGKLTYQWQSSTKQNSGFKNIAGSAAKKSSYSVPTKKKGTIYYRCVVTNTDSTAVTKKTSVTSTVAKVIVK